MRILDEKESNFVSGAYYCSHCPRNPDGSMAWIQGPNDPPYPPGKEPVTPNANLLIASFAVGAFGGFLSGARLGVWGALAGAVFGGAMGVAGRSIFDYSYLNS